MSKADKIKITGWLYQKNEWKHEWLYQKELMKDLTRWWVYHTGMKRPLYQECKDQTLNNQQQCQNSA